MKQTDTVANDTPDFAYIEARIVATYYDTLEKMYPGFEFYEGGASDKLPGVDKGVEEIFDAAKAFVRPLLERDMQNENNRHRVIEANLAVAANRLKLRARKLQEHGHSKVRLIKQTATREDDEHSA